MIRAGIDKRYSTEGLETPIDHVIISVKNVHARVGMLYEGPPCPARIRKFIASVSFPRIRVQLAGPYCCLYPMTILMNGALSRIPWRVRYLSRGTMDRLKARGVSPELSPNYR